MQAGSQRPVAHIKHRAPGWGLTMQAVDPCAEPVDRRTQAKGSKDGEPGLLQHEAGANRRGPLELLEHLNPVPLPGEQGRCGQAADTGAGNGNIKTLDQAGLPPR